jgi:hypothetical protein
MLVVGGAYRERCVTPEREAVAGSGLRAAAVLRAVEPDVRLVAGRDERDGDLYASAAAAFGLDVRWLPRSSPIAFDYFTPLSTPAISGRSSRLTEQPPEQTDDEALVFGMIEGRPPVRARAVVIDPQQPRELARLDIDDIEAERIAVVLNTAETAAISGSADVSEGARRILDAHQVEVVVTKRAMRGALVTTADSQTLVGPRRTSSVWPIGSGDAFAAGFAHAWATENADPIAAAEIGSRVAAKWCSTAMFDVEADVFHGQVDVGSDVSVNDASVYLAAPFFTLAERWLVDLCRAALGPHVFSPLHEVGRRIEADGAVEVAAADLDGLDRCDAVLALVDRSDPGTIFEAGWATRAGLPVVAYGEMIEDSAAMMIGGTGADLTDDLSTAVYWAVWSAMSHAVDG